MKEMSQSLPPRRRLGRTAVELPPVIWELDRPPAESIIDSCTRRAADWVATTGDFVWPLPPALRVVLEVDVQELLSVGDRLVRTRLADLGRTTADAVVLRGVTPGELKGGRPFQRLSALREEGLTSLLLIDTPDALSAEWIADNTPIHGLIVPFDRGDQAARYRLFDVAADAGVGLLARTSNVSFALAHEAIVSAVVPLPPGPGDCRSILDAAAAPLPKDEVDLHWQAYQAANPPPPKLRGNHPPDFA